MKKIALITCDNLEGLKKDSIINKLSSTMKTIFYGFLPNKTDKLTLEDEQLILFVIKIPNGKNVRTEKITSRLEDVWLWMKEEKINAVSFDKYLTNNYHEHILKNLVQMGTHICYGNKVFLSLAVKTLKRVLKSKGLAMSEVDVAIVSDGKSDYEVELIKYLSPHVRYLTYVCGNNNKISWLIDDIFNNLGFCIRICSNIKECINDVGLIINLTADDIIPKNLFIKSKIIVFNINGNLITNRANITVVNDIAIDISSKIPLNIDNKCKYSLCEMYILSKLDKLYLLKQYVYERDFEDIIGCFNASCFKITSIDGVNL